MSLCNDDGAGEYQLIEPKCGPLCPNCPLFTSGQVIKDREPLDPETWSGLTVVGETPGREELQRGVVFCGPSGRLLDAAMKATGITDVDNIHVTNAIRCGLRGGVKLPGTKSTKAAIECCRPVLLSNLAQGTKSVLALGGVAWQALSNLEGIEKWRGCYIPSIPEEPYPVLCTLHPAAMLREPTRRPWFDMFCADVRKAYDAATGKVKPFEPEVCEVSLLRVLFMLQAEEIALDVETDSKDALTANIRTVGISVAMCDDNGWEGIETVSVPFPSLGHRYRWCSDEDFEKVEEAFKRVFADPEVKLIFHNKSYDVPVIERHFGVKIECVREDTILMHAALYPKTPHDLQAVASHYLLIEPWKAYFDSPFDTIELVKKKEALVAGYAWPLSVEDHQEIVDRRISELLYYNSIDTATTCELYYLMKRDLEAADLWRVYESDRALVDISIDWSRVGVLVDEPARLELSKTYGAEVKTLLAELQAMARPDDVETTCSCGASVVGQPGTYVPCQHGDETYYALLPGELKAEFNPASPKQLKDVLIEKFNIVPGKTTATGDISTNAEALFEYREHPFVAKLLLFREKAKLFSTYIEGMAEKVGHDGRLHPVYSLHVTPSGRFATKPNLQNWPPSMKKMLVPAKGRVVISADYSALELRIVALLAGQEDQIEVFNSGGDIHALQASRYFVDIWDKATPAERKELRKKSKPVTFGDIYRASAPTLFEQVRPEVPDIKLETVKIMQARKRAAEATIGEWCRYVHKYANDKHELRTAWSGRRRRWPMGDVADTEAANHPVQAGAGDVMAEATIRWINLLQAKGDYHVRVFPCLQIHDDLRAEVDADYALTALRDLLECMVTVKSFKSPVTHVTNVMLFTAEGSIGPNHADLVEQKELNEEIWNTLRRRLDNA
jgi:uracil-DNA glycosylase family 4